VQAGRDTKLDRATPRGQIGLSGDEQVAGRQHTRVLPFSADRPLPFIGSISLYQQSGASCNESLLKFSTNGNTGHVYRWLGSLGWPAPSGGTVPPAWLSWRTAAAGRWLPRWPARLYGRGPCYHSPPPALRQYITDRSYP
jgi:hypothetical protein